MEEGTVQAYADTCGSILESSPQMDEANTKAAVLRDFLNLLGWSIPENTQLEYSVEEFDTTYKVDYALILEGAPVAFIEAKGADTALTPGFESKLGSYMKGENVNYGILTNGKEYRFFQRHIAGANVEVQKVGQAELAELPNRMTMLRAYTKDAVETGESEKILGRINELREAKRILEASKDEIADELVAVLSETVSEEISSLAESQAKELVDRLAQDIEDEIDIQDSPEPRGMYTARLLNGQTHLATFSSDNQSEVMAETVSYLISEHNLISQIQPLPYIPGDKRAIIHDNEQYNGREMHQAKPLVDDYVVEVNLSVDKKVREIRQLVERCGLEVSFSGGW